MSEGLYEEPISMSTRMREAIYENARDAILIKDHGVSLQKERRYHHRFSFFPVRNFYIYLGLIVSVIMTAACLALIVQLSDTYKNDMAKLHHALLHAQHPTGRPASTTVTVGLYSNLTINEEAPGPKLRNASLPTTLRPDFRGILFEGKCFVVIPSNSTSITLANSRASCREVGGKLANVYNLQHYRKIANLMRGAIPDGLTAINCWTGMTFDSQRRRVLLSSDRPTTFAIPWLKGRPRAPALPYVGINIHKLSNFYNQGLFDERSSARLQCALCEV